MGENGKQCSKAIADASNVELLGSCGTFACVENIKKLMLDEATQYASLLKQGQGDYAYQVAATFYREELVVIVKTRIEARTQSILSSLKAHVNSKCKD
jgi:hypothetical protein